MCATCGCGDSHDHDHAHSHDHHHPHTHARDPRPPRTIRLERDVLGRNAGIARRNRDFFEEHGIAAVNLMSSPGAGKTTLLEHTYRRLATRVPLSAIEGDQETERDAERLRRVGFPVVQINTGPVCHLDAAMVERGLKTLAPTPGSVLFIENVGNLVCPAMFDLGERERVVLVSTTEGEDKPLKYPHIFRDATTMVLSKVDLLPHLSFDADACVANALRVNPKLRVFRLSATSGEGLGPWCDWLAGLARHAEPGRVHP